MKPPVGSNCEFEGQLVILDIVPADIDVVTVRGYVVIGFTLELYGLSLYVMLSDIACLGKLPSDPCKILFALCYPDAGKDRFEMLKALLHILSLHRKCFSGSLELCISVKIFYGILLCRDGGIKGNGLFFIRIIVIDGYLLVTRLSRITEGIEKLAPDAVFVASLGLLQLLELLLLLLCEEPL